MKEKELFKQLHNLSQMQPDAEWKKEQRALMLNQIDAGKVGEANDSISLGDIIKLPIAALQSFSQPVMVAFLIVFMILTGGFAGLRASQDSKPGDSLYLAKIVGEKTQLALTLSSEKKAKLGLEFAVKRAEEIKQVIESEEESDSKDEKVEKLVQEYKKELKVAKQHIEKISKDSSPVTINENEGEESSQQEASQEPKDPNEATTTEEETQIFTAGSQKSDNGLQISDNSIPETVARDDEEGESVVEQEIDSREVAALGSEQVSSTTDDISSSTEAIIEELLEEERLSPEALLEKAPSLLEARAYDELVGIIEEANSAIDETIGDKGQVKGVEESVGSEEQETDSSESLEGEGVKDGATTTE